MVNVQKKAFKRKLQKMKKISQTSGETKKKKLDRDEEEEERQILKNEEQETSPSSSSDNEQEEEIATKEVEETQKKQAATVKSSILTDREFDSLHGQISNKTLEAVKTMGFSKMTQIQDKTIDILLQVGSLFFSLA